MVNTRITPRDFVADIEKDMRCNCDLDKWGPELTTGHSFVCRIHRAAMERYRLAVLHKRNTWCRPVM